MMHDAEIYAIVVTYQPDDEVASNLAALRRQADNVVVVDNGSSAERVFALREQAIRDNFSLIESDTNRGIAAALNIGVRWVQKRNERGGRAKDVEPYVILFDQDSRVSEGMLRTMLEAFRKSSRGQALGILVPAYIDPKRKSVVTAPRLASGLLESAMTSGSFMRLELFERCGLFVEELFIDAVDEEYSLRIRKLGYVIDECGEAFLLHAPGSIAEYRIAGRRLFTTTNHSPLRLYYQVRNRIWVAKHYGRVFPGFCFRLLTTSAKQLFKVLLVEDNKLKKFRFSLVGAYHGIRSRTGKHGTS